VRRLSNQLSFRGGAGIPVDGTRLHASAPLVVLTLAPEGVRMDLRPRWLRALAFSLLPGPHPPDPKGDWSVAATALERVIVGRSSVVFIPKEGRLCRFVRNRHVARRVEEVARSYGWPVQRVFTTLRYTWRSAYR
jgi:hypothetical protein